MAGRLAAALRAHKLLLLTNTPGLLDADGRLMDRVDAARADALIAQGVIRDGMLPKVQCALDAVAQGVDAAHIVDGRVEHAVLLEIFTDAGVGTLIEAVTAPG